MHPAEPPLIIVGAGGHGREMAWVTRAAFPERRVLGFLDDAPALRHKQVADLPVLGTIEEWARFTDSEFILAFGAPRMRRDAAARMEHGGTPRYATLVHPQTVLGPRLVIGHGTMIGPGAVVSTDVVLGRHVLVNIGASISHDAEVRDFATLAPGVRVPGAARIGEGAEIALGACLRQGLTIGSGAVIGAGAVITRDIEPCAVMIGNPARLLRNADQF